VSRESRLGRIPRISGGERKVCAFTRETIGEDSYMFLFVDGTLDNNQPDSDQLLLSAFGRQLGPEAAVIHAYPEYAHKAYAQVRDKDWPDEVQNRMVASADPFILVLENDFDAFDPRLHRFAILWLDNFGKFGGTERQEELRGLLTALARVVREPGQDVFGYVESVVADRAALSPAAARKRVWENFRGAAADASAVIESAREGTTPQSYT
jgi:hypothetical protein